MCYADTLSVEAAAKLMHKNASFVRKGLQAKRFDFGYAVETSKGRWNYYINRKKFFETTGIEEVVQ